jgi:hypothetical protein
VSARWLGIAALAVALVAVPAAVSDSSVWYRDAAGDVRGGPGPDIRFVRATDRGGRISLRVVFAKSPPLAVSTKRGFTDMLIVTIWTTGKTGPRQPHYWLGVHAADLTGVALVNALKRSSVRLGPAVVSGKTVTLSLDADRIGDPRVIRFSVAAGREMNEGRGGGGDLAPDHGTSLLWVR